MTEKKELISIIEKFPTMLRSEIDKLSTQDLDKVVVTWTIRQIVHHLADSHVNSYIRLKMALTEENPTIKPYDESKWAKLADYDAPIEISLNMITAINERLIIVLKQMKEEDWNRTLYHPEIGTVTFLDYIQVVADHGEGHLSKFR